MFSRCGIENKIEAFQLPLHRLFVARQHDLVRAEPLRVPRFARRGRKEDQLRSESSREFHGHMAEPAESDDTYLLAFAHLPMPDCRLSCNAGAYQRSRYP